MFPRFNLLLFRAALLTALLVILHLATTQLHYPGVDGLNDKVSHIMAFYALAILEDFSFPRTDFGLSKVLTLMAYGLMIEVVQYFLPYRVGDPGDVGLGVLGATWGAALFSTSLLKDVKTSDVNP